MSYSRLFGIAALALGLAACDNDDDNGTGTENVIGSTPGFLNGNTVTFDYTQEFACQNPPASGATSKCVVGAAAQTRPAGAPAGSTPTLWVMTPLFTPAPPAGTLHCSMQGSCVTHPSTIDVSAALGPSAANAPLPPHSHVIDTQASTSRPFEIKVVGVKDLTTWNALIAGKNLATIRSQQAADPQQAKITADLPSNLFLFFKTR